MWEKGIAIPSEGTAEYVIFANYICQHLNLFEMAIRFRKEGVMPREVFGSWVVWFFDICTAPNFGSIWQNLKLNYAHDLQEIMDEGISTGKKHGSDLEEARREFFEYVANVLRCDVVRHWLSSR